MSAMPGTWLESPQSPIYDDESYQMYSHVPTPINGDDDCDSVDSFETCRSTICEDAFEPSPTYQFRSHMLPSLQHRSNEFNALGPVQKRRRCYTRISNDNPTRSRANDSRPRKPLIRQRKLQNPTEEAKKETIIIETTSNIRTPEMANLENELARLTTLVHDRDEQLASREQKLKVTLGIVQIRDVKIARMDKEKLALEKAVEEHAVSEEMMAAKLSTAEFLADIRQHFDKSEVEVNDLREAAKTQWQRANNAEQRIQCLENDLAKANSELQEARNAGESTSTLQQRLDASLESCRNSEQESESLRAALTRSEDNAKETYRQALAQIQTLSEEANREVQRLNELGAGEEARAHQAEQANRSLQQRNEAQDALIQSLQDEAQRWERHAKDRLEQATYGATKVDELTQEVSEVKNRAQIAEAKVKELEEKLANHDTPVAEQGEATREPSPDEMEAACAITSMNDRLERELDEANDLLEELALKGMDGECQDALESLVKTNQVFKQVEELFEDYYSPRVDEVNAILEDAMSNLDMRRFIDLADKPVLVQQLKKAHHARTIIDDILEGAEIAYQVYLDEERTKEIAKIIKSPRTLPKTDDDDDDAAAATSPPPRAPQPTTSSSTTTASPLYNPPRPQPPLSTPQALPGFFRGQQLPGLTTNPNASPTSGAPTPYNPLWSLSQTTSASPTAPSPSSTSRLHGPSPLRSLVPEFQPHEASSSSEHDSNLDAEGDTDDELNDNVMPEAFEGEHDHGSDYDDDEPAVVSRPIRMPVSKRRRRAMDEDVAVFM